MEHLDEGLIQAFLDKETTGTDGAQVQVHLDVCAECRNQVRLQGERLSQVGEALRLLDLKPKLEEARGRVRAWAMEGREESTTEGYKTVTETSVPAGERPTVTRAAASWWRSLGSLPKAASIALLLSAAAATALPGSPVRQWIMDGWHAFTGNTATQTDQGEAVSGQPEAALEGAVSVPEETGASILPGGEGVEVWVQELSAGAEVSVLWTDDDQVRIFSGEGTGYRTANGRLEAVSPTGSVRIQIPRTLRNVVVGANGQVLMRKTGNSLEVLVPTLNRTPDEIRFAPLVSSDRGES